MEDNIRAGMAEEEARRRLRLEFGGLDQVKEECRDARGTMWVETTRQDIQFAWRTLWKSPGFALAAICTLALGIGANTAIFSVVYAVLLKPLPYAAPGQLVSVAGEVPQLRARFPSLSLRARDFDAFRRSNSVFSGMAALRSQEFNLTGVGEPEKLYGARVSANFFSMLGVQPERGRTFLPEEDEPFPAAYRPVSQAPFGDVTLVARTAQEPEALASAVRNEVWKLDRNLPVASMQTMREIVSASTASRRFRTMLMVAFAVLSLALAVVGIYGVTSYSVARQTREIGLRMALGAQQSDVLGSVLAQGLRPVAVGLALGLAVAGFAGESMRALLFGIEPLDPVSLGGVSFVLLLTATLACYLPARRASSIAPVIALGFE